MARGKKVDVETKKRVQKGVAASKRASDFVKKIANQPMGPGQSMAMAGNTGLAGFSPNQVEEIKKGQEAINQFKGNTSEPVTYQEIGQQIGEMGSKYRRPVDYERYADRMRMLNEGIAGGGKFFIGPDGIPRFSFMGMENKPMDSSGQKFLSIMLPELTASAPTLSQLGGDISRAFTGYDSIKYPDQNFQGPFPSGQNVNTAFMQTTPGMFSNINPLSIIPGAGMAMKIGEGIKGVYDYFTKDPVVTTGGSSDITVTEVPTFVSPTFDDQKIEVQQLPALLPPSQQGDATFRNDYPFLYDSRLDNLPFKAIPNNINDQTNFQKSLANARVENTGLGLDSLKAAYDFARNPTLNTQYGDFSLDNVFRGNPQLNYGNTVMINGVPVDLSASIGQGGISGGLSFSFNKGGSVNKHSGLGYMLK
mgnify:FL=1|tara:strand:- start:2129 stop:3388 length:1260 start_codon:yes stop_codon:yes gene_type:complete